MSWLIIFTEGEPSSQLRTSSHALLVTQSWGVLYLVAETEVSLPAGVGTVRSRELLARVTGRLAREADVVGGELRGITWSTMMRYYFFYYARSNERFDEKLNFPISPSLCLRSLIYS